MHVARTKRCTAMLLVVAVLPPGQALLANAARLKALLPPAAAPARRRQQPMTMMAAPSGCFASREDMFVMIYADTYAVPQPCRMYRLRLPAS